MLNGILGEDDTEFLLVACHRTPCLKCTSSQLVIHFQGSYQFSPNQQWSYWVGFGADILADAIVTISQCMLLRKMRTNISK